MTIRVLLLAVPVDNPVYLPAGLGYLSGYLKRALGPDVELFQRDLNTDFIQWIVGKPLVDAMRSLEHYRDFALHCRAREEISAKMLAATDGAVNIARNSIIFRPHEDYKSREGVLAAVENRRESAFSGFYESAAVPYIAATKSDVVGISVKDQKQYLSAFILAAMIKERLPETKVVLGGNVLTRNYDVHCRDDGENRELFRYIDGIIHHEGEIAFAEYVRAAAEGRAISTVPKLIYLENGHVRENLEFPVAQMDCIPPPDYSGFIAQGNYWTPAPVIPYILARGCYWGQCSFCDIPIGYDFSGTVMGEALGKQFQPGEKALALRRERTFGKVLADLRFLSEKYSTRWFSFGDEELDSPTLRRFATREDADELPLAFECYSRIEEDYASDGGDFCRRLASSGCRFLQFGLESVSMPVLERNRKYPTPHKQDSSGDAFRQTYEAGIMNHAFILVGLPGDSLLEASKVVPYLERYAQYLTTIKPVFHKISKWSPIALHPERYGIVLDREGSGDLDVNLNLGKGSTVMSRHRAEAFVRFLDLWIRRYHKVNISTSQYVYAQRLFVGRDELERMASDSSQEANIDEYDGRLLRKVYSGLLEEIKLAVCSAESELQDRRRAFARLYGDHRGTRGCTFEEVLDLVRKSAEIQGA